VDHAERVAQQPDNLVMHRIFKDPSTGREIRDTATVARTEAGRPGMKL